MRKTFGALAALAVVSFLIGCGGSEPPSVEGAVGSLTVTTDPSGAAVFLDGVAEGVTTTTIRNIAVGEHELRLELAGHDPEVRTITIVEGENAPMTVPLRPTATQRGYLAVTTDPAIIDGVPVVAQVVLNDVPQDGPMTNGDTAAQIPVDTTQTWMVSVEHDEFLGVPEAHVCDPGATIPVAVRIGSKLNGQHRASSDGRIVDVESRVERDRVEVHIVGEATLVASGNDLFWGDDLSHAGSVASDHRSFTITYMGESETYTGL